MSRKVVRLTLDHLDELTAPCRSCVFWQLDPVRRQRVEDPADEVDAWVSAVLRDWGSCGRVVLVDGVPKGFALYAPGGVPAGCRRLRDRAGVGGRGAADPRCTSPPTPGAAVSGRMLVQGMARDLMERGGIKAVEAFGDTRGDPGWKTKRPPRDHARGSRCVASVEFLSSVGFKTHRPHARNPRMRMDLRSALTWRDEVEAALEKLIGVVRPAPKPTTERPQRAHRDRDESQVGRRVRPRGTPRAR